MLLGWATVKALTISSSGGLLTNSSTDAQVEAFIYAGVVQAYGVSNVSGSCSSAELIYRDGGHYLLEHTLPSGSKPYFKGSPVNSSPNVDFRISYCLTAGDETTIYSTICSGSQSGSQLTLSPANIHFSVNGLNNQRVGNVSNINTFIL